MKKRIQAMIKDMVLAHIHHYNHKKYWKMRAEVVNPQSKKFYLIRLWYLYRIKRMDGFNVSSTGTLFGGGAQFASPPSLPHFLNGIIISNRVKIGKHCTIFQQVTITQAAEIGDNVFIGSGAKIIGNVKIGDNAKIGANAVVLKDVPANCTAVGVPARIIPDKKEDI